MNFDSISDFIAFVNDTKRYEDAVANLKAQKDSVEAALAKQVVVGGIAKAKEAAEALQAKAVEAVAKAQVQADKLIADATVIYDKRHRELKEREILAEQAIMDLKGLQDKWTNREAELRSQERVLQAAREQVEKERADLASKQQEVDQRLDKLRQAMG